MIPEFHPSASEELEVAVREGLKFGQAVAGRLRDETRRVALLLCDTPNIGEPIDPIHKRFSLNGFPFALVYRVDGEFLRIIAFAHKRRRPRYWSRRK